MASTLSTLKTLLTQKLGQSNTGFHSEPNREAAINEAIGDIAEAYGQNIIELIKRDTLTLVSGEAADPADFLRMMKVWDTDDNEFTFLTPDEFDPIDDDSGGNYWTRDYSTTASAVRIMVKPTDVTSLNIRYVIVPTTLSDDADTTEIPTLFDEGIAYMAASILYKNEHNPAFQFMDEAASRSIMSSLQSIRKHGGSKQGERLRSRYESYPMFRT